MKQLSISDKPKPTKTTVAQFGTGNFLRGFSCRMIDAANEKGVFDGGVAVIKNTPHGSIESFAEQSCTYTVILRGLANGAKSVDRRIIGTVTQVCNPYGEFDEYLHLATNKDLRFVISNTTEAGIVYDEKDSFDQRPASSFPGKLTQFLYARYTRFDGADDCGLIILPTELIEENGKKLSDCINKLITLWGLPKSFADWVNNSCIFCNTLVDRIVSGYPADEAEMLERDLLGYRDKLLVVGEPFGLWVIESPRYKEIGELFPLDRADMPVVFTDDLRPYAQQKVRILNGAHTSTALAAYLAGFDIVSELMADKTMRSFIEKAVYEEISPTVPLPQDQVKKFADSVMERFENPFLKHKLLSISLNSVSKWKARILPSLKDSFRANGSLPSCLTFSLAALLTFYGSDKQGDGFLIGNYGDRSYEIRDDAFVLSYIAENANKTTEEFAELLLGNTDFWGEDLNALGNMTAMITSYMHDIEKFGIAKTIENLLAK